MWYIHESITHKTDLVSKAGKTYSAFILKGEKKGFPVGSPNEPYERIILPSTSATVIEHGIQRPNISVADYFMKAVKPGEMIEIKFNRTSKGADIVSVENITNRTATAYTPLSEQEVRAAYTSQQSTPSTTLAGGSELPWLQNAA